MGGDVTVVLNVFNAGERHACAPRKRPQPWNRAAAPAARALAARPRPHRARARRDPCSAAPAPRPRRRIARGAAPAARAHRRSRLARRAKQPDARPPGNLSVRLAPRGRSAAYDVRVRDAPWEGALELLAGQAPEASLGTLEPGTNQSHTYTLRAAVRALRTRGAASRRGAQPGRGCAVRLQSGCGKRVAANAAYAAARACAGPGAVRGRACQGDVPRQCRVRLHAGAPRPL